MKMAASSALRLSPEDYITGSCEPDCDLVDGQLQERSVGDLEHSRMRLGVLLWFATHIDVIEILSPEDRISRYREGIEDYRAMGVKHIWIVDPLTLDGFDCSSGSWTPTRQVYNWRTGCRAGSERIEAATVNARLDD